MDSDSDSPFNYSWPSLPKMRIRRRQQHSTFHALKKSKNPPTFLAAARLSAMLNGSDEVYANCMVVNQVGDLDINYVNVDSVTTETSSDPTNSNEDNQGAVNNMDNRDPQPFSSPYSSYTAGSYISHGFTKERSQLYADMKKRSSSLDDLEVDSGGEGISNRSHNCYSSVSFNSSAMSANSRDELDSPETFTELDFNINRTESLSFSNNLQSKESLLSGIRSRSYSCSSPKVLLEKSRFSRDFAICDSNEEQRAYSLPEHSREKRSQEEEWDKYIIPTKSESEKYKVSRTFSFLMNRMTSTRNKSKTKNKDAKEKLNRHQFVTGTLSGFVPCVVCEKALSGKESMQCSCNASVHKSCKDCAPACTKVSQTNLSSKEIPPPAFSPLHPSSSIPIGLSSVKKEALLQSHSLPKSIPSTTLERFVQPLEQDTDVCSWRSKSQSEELLQAIGPASSVDSLVIEDDVDSSVWSDLSMDALEFEAESWSLVVDPVFCSKQEKDVIKRQDVIFGQYVLILLSENIAWQYRLVCRHIQAL
uniref:Phorbol-ester/DAG-type domain-containing protein n=1 Tax=Sphenodon punctatus TaxID=8508 RepID=A0A8D0FYW9_SPHPU